MMYYGRFCPEILQVLQQFVRPGDTVLDIGAQLGYFSLHAARLVSPTGRVYCFEPDPRSFARLEHAIRLSRIDWIKSFQTALSAREGTMDFYLSPTLGWSTGVKNSHLEDLQQVSVRTSPLDLLVSQGEIPSRMRLVKIDVEGFEMEVLRGMRNVLATSRPILVLEINVQMLHAQGTSPSEIVRFLESLEYDVSRIDKDLRWWRTRPRMRLCPADASLQVGCDLVCTPSELLTIGASDPGSDLEQLSTRD
jgi:FkbM family methyltransferase